jgi:hypothetical protein
MTLTDPTHADRPPAAPAVAAPDRVGRIETHGIDHIPDAERHGRPIELFWVWAGANVNYLSLVVGGTLVLMGLSLPQALAVIVIGNLGWLLPGFLSVSGPAAGAPSEVITRAMYGVRGNRVYTAISGWVISVCYFALNLAAASVAAFALLERIGIEPNPIETIVVVVAIAAITLAISVFGHATIVRLYLPITIALIAAFAVVGTSVLTVADFSAAPAEKMSGIELWATIAAGVTLIAAGRCRTPTARTSPATCPAPRARSRPPPGPHWAAFCPACWSARSGPWPRPRWTCPTRRTPCSRSCPAGSRRCSCWPWCWAPSRSAR